MTDKELLKRAEEIKDECHQLVAETIKANPSLSYQDAVNVFIFLKIAQLEDALSTKQTKATKIHSI